MLPSPVFLAVALLGPTVGIAYPVFSRARLSGPVHEEYTLPLCQVFLIILLYQAFCYVDEDWPLLGGLAVFGLVLGVVNVLTVRQDLKVERELAARREELRNLKTAIDSQNARIQAVLGAKRQAQDVREELVSKIADIRQLVEVDAMSAEQLEKDVSAWSIPRARCAVPLYCQNPVVDALVAGKVQEAAQRGVVIHSSLDIPRETPLDPAELCSLFGNLLDNAIKAQEKLSWGKKTVQIAAHIRAGIFSVRCQNAVGEVGDTPFEKADPQRFDEHGWGLEIINDIARRHQGKMAVSASEGMFCMNVVMHLDQQGEDCPLDQVVC